MKSSRNYGCGPKALAGAALCAAIIAAAGSASATTWHVDSEGGDDAAAGTSPATAWKTLERVNNAKIAPGDKVLFKRGGLWRGTLRPASGENGNPVTYSWYGKGPKPILEQSVDRSKPEDWTEESPGIWTTKIAKPELVEQVWDGASCEGWSCSWQEGVKGTLKRVSENGETFVRANCTEKPASKSNYVQIWGPKVDVRSSGAVLRLKVRSSKPFRLGRADLMLSKPPWSKSMQGDAPYAVIGTEWQTIDVFLTKAGDAQSTAIHLPVGDVLPEGAVFDFVPVGIWSAKFDTSA